MNALAIVIPYYKIDFFEETLKSVAAQTDKRFVLYIGNDASANDPLPLIEKYFPHGNYHYFNYEENLGGKNLAMQWERILDNVKEDWFQILGDDDMISDNFVETFYNCLQEITKYESNVIKFAQRWIDETGKYMTGTTKYSKLILPLENLKYKLIDGDPSSLSEHIFRTDAYERHRFEKFPLAWHSDDCAVLQFSEKKSIYFVSNARVLIRISNRSISGSTSDEDQKALASYKFWGTILNKYYISLPREYLINKIQIQINYAFRHNISLNVNLFKIYLFSGQFKRLLKVPIIHYYLKRK